MDFAKITELRHQVDQQSRTWKTVLSTDEKKTFKASVEAQCELNRSFLDELQRLRDEFAHFKLHTISHIDGTGNSVLPKTAKTLHCVANPFRLYQLSQT